MAIRQLSQNKAKHEMDIPAAAAGWRRRRRSAAMHTLPDAENTTMENRSSGPQNSVQRLWRSLQVWQIASRVQTCFQPRLCSSQAFQFPQENPGNATTKRNDDAAASAVQGIIITVASTKPNNCFFCLQHHTRKKKKRSSKSLQKLFHNLKHRSSEADTTGEAEEEDDNDGMVDNADNATEENTFMTKS